MAGIAPGPQQVVGDELADGAAGFESRLVVEGPVDAAVDPAGAASSAASQKPSKERVMTAPPAAISAEEVNAMASFPKNSARTVAAVALTALWAAM